MHTKKALLRPIFIAAGISGCAGQICHAVTLESYGFIDNFDSLNASTQYADISSTWS